ncbi:unnamed protein product [Spirodela intermedia]|uniref:DUF7781 domain-containing protein n=1 Tax=Spirodela intermedia TaxID=51605 RepID=A0A7I8J2E4_SPIIN|nr:unnamed protein product [Spirodela intermedia]CAA6664229.1 unnamed protein product [Spirodela intermedia]
MASPSLSPAGDGIIRGDAGREEPPSLEDLYHINVFPSKLFLKFRKEVQGIRLGLNLEVGVGHNYHLNAIGWKWKLSTSLGGDGISQIRNKTSIGLFPGFDLRIGWKAEYILPEINGSVGAGEPIFNMSYGRLHASIDKLEAILTHES